MRDPEQLALLAHIVAAAIGCGPGAVDVAAPLASDGWYNVSARGVTGRGESAERAAYELVRHFRGLPPWPTEEEMARATGGGS